MGCESIDSSVGVFIALVLMKVKKVRSPRNEVDSCSFFREVCDALVEQ